MDEPTPDKPERSSGPPGPAKGEVKRFRKVKPLEDTGPAS